MSWMNRLFKGGTGDLSQPQTVRRYLRLSHWLQYFSIFDSFMQVLSTVCTQGTLDVFSSRLFIFNSTGGFSGALNDWDWKKEKSAGDLKNSTMTQSAALWRRVARHGEGMKCFRAVILKSVPARGEWVSREWKNRAWTTTGGIRAPWWISDASLLETKWVLSLSVRGTFYNCSCIFALSWLDLKLVSDLLYVHRFLVSH